MSTTLEAGNWARVKGTFLNGDGTVLAANTVLLANVTLRYRSSIASADVNVTNASANVSSGVTAQAGVDNGFQCDVYVPDATPTRVWWQFRFEDSQHGIAIENDDLKLYITASLLVTP